MPSTRPPGLTGLHNTNAIDAGTLVRNQSPNPQLNGHGPNHPDISDPSLVELRELGLDLLQMALDLAGIVDPTPVSDGASGLLALARGQWFDALISGASMIPYIGDLAKAGKLPRYLKTIEKAVLLAEKSAEAAKTLLPGMRKLKEVLDLIPANANKQIDEIRAVVNRFINTHTTAAITKVLPDIRKSFRFNGPIPVVKGGKRYELRTAEGRLGVPAPFKIIPFLRARATQCLRAQGMTRVT